MARWKSPGRLQDAITLQCSHPEELGSTAGFPAHCPVWAPFAFSPPPSGPQRCPCSALGKCLHGDHFSDWNPHQLNVENLNHLYESGKAE